MTISMYRQYNNLIERFSIVENAAIQTIAPLYQEQMLANNTKLIVPLYALQVLYDLMCVNSGMPLATYVRYHRDILLQQSDYSQVPDSTIDKASWAVYRQELRDMSAQLEFPDNVTWPVSPDDK